MMYGNRSNGYGYSPDRSRDVDRFNTSTKACYTYFDPWKLSGATYKNNNGQYSNHYTKTNKYN